MGSCVFIYISVGDFGAKLLKIVETLSVKCQNITRIGSECCKSTLFQTTTHKLWLMKCVGTLSMTAIAVRTLFVRF